MTDLTPRRRKSLINSLEHIRSQDGSRPDGNTYSVYIVQVKRLDSTAKVIDFYIGETGRSVEARFARHQAAAEKSAGMFRRGRYAAQSLRYDLMKGFPTFQSRNAARRAERRVAVFLSELGYSVHFG